MIKQNSDDVETAHAFAEPSIMAAMRDRTHVLHTQAERSGIVNDILRGHGNLAGYILFLRNLLPAYQAMETGLARHRESDAVACIARPELYRANAIESDLVALHGADWHRAIPLLPAAETYARRVAICADGDGTRLIAHAYARYLGDLSGGQILKRLLARSLQLQPQSLSFYDFPEIQDANAFKANYRRMVDAAANHIMNREAVIAESAVAFELNIALSDAVQAAAPATELAAS